MSEALADDIQPNPDVPRSGRAVAWDRRRASARGMWRGLRNDRLAMAGLIVLVLFALMAFAAPLLSDKSSLSAANTGDNPVWAPPSWEFLFGTDHLGHSVAAQFLWGSRISLFVGLMATLLQIGIGSLVGLTAGFFGGWVDAVLMRITDWFLVVPFLPLAIVLAAVLERGLWTIILVIGITSWPSTARLLRSQVLSVRQRLYVDRARSLGAGRLHLMRRHILPNVTPLILASTTLAVPISILTETTLSFLGLGDPPSTSWGGMLNAAKENSAISGGRWWAYMPPGLGIVFVVLAVTLFGRALEEILDPRLRDR